MIHIDYAGLFQFFIDFSQLFVLSFGLVNYSPAITENVEIAIKALTDGICFVHESTEITTFRRCDAVPFQSFLDFVSSFIFGCIFAAYLPAFGENAEGGTNAFVVLVFPDTRWWVLEPAM